MDGYLELEGLRSIWRHSNSRVGLSARLLGLWLLMRFNVFKFVFESALGSVAGQVPPDSQVSSFHCDRFQTSLPDFTRTTMTSY